MSADVSALLASLPAHADPLNLPLNLTAPAPVRSPNMRAVPAGRGLSREAASRDAAASDPLNLSGMGLGASGLTLGDRPPPGRRKGGAAGAGGGGGGGGAGSSGGDGSGSDRSSPPLGGTLGGTLGSTAGSLVEAGKMMRAKEWSPEVEHAYRLQEAGYRDEAEALGLGHPPIERWNDANGFIRKLVTRETLGKEAASTLYFSKKREAEDKELHRIKLYG